MTTPARPLPPIEAFQQAARRYVQLRGWQGADAEDLLSEMTVEALEHPTTPRAMRYCYQHALDRLNPRSRDRTGQRLRQAARTLSLDAPEGTAPDARPLLETIPLPPAPEADPWAPAVLTRLLRRLPPGAALVLRAYYLEGLTERALGHRLGVTESRVSQLLSQAQAQLIYAAHLDRRRHRAR